MNKDLHIDINQGYLIEYLQDNQPVLAWILEGDTKHLRILNINKRILKLPISRVLPWIGPSFPRDMTREDILHNLALHHNYRNKLIEAIDPLEIWELTYEEINKARVQWFAGLIWNDPDSDQIAALGRTLLQCRTHFKFITPEFEVYSSQKVHQKIVEQQKIKEEQRIVHYGQSFFYRLWQKTQNSNHKKPLPELPPDIEDQLKKILHQGISGTEDNDFSKIWKQIKHELPDVPNLPLILAQSWGLVQRHYNFLLDQAGYVWGDEWSDAFADELKRQEEALLHQRPTPDLNSFISIDSSTTRDIDDAFTISLDDQGNYHLQIALACPVLFWEFGSELDQAVAHRTTSLYLPEGTSHMLPEKLGTNIFSLHAEQSKPIILFDCHINSNGELRSYDFQIEWGKIRNNLSYSQAEHALFNNTSPELNLAYELSKKLRHKRINHGAVIIEQEHPIIHLENNDHETEVWLESPKTSPKAQLVVSEFMIMTNTVIAQWSKEHQVPLLYRTQDIVLPLHTAGIWTNPVDIYQIIKEMSSSRLDFVPRLHASLGVKGYAPITSPLRRYTDFINLGQLVSYLQEGKSIWSQDDLQRMISYLSARIESVGKIQRHRTRYWKLLYFKKRCTNTYWTGIVVSDDGPNVTLSLPKEQILLKGPKKLFGDKLYLGQRFRLSLGHIDPLNNEIKITNAWEE